MGNSSRRPASISKISTHLLKSVMCAKDAVGPTRERPGPMLLMVAATAVKVDEAAKFINYWVNDEEANLFIAGRRGVPINPEIATLVGQSLDENSMKVFEYMNMMAGYASDLYAPDPQAHGEISDEYNRQVQAVLFGQSTPEEAAQALVDYINKTLKE